MIHDLRFALRLLRKDPVPTVVAIATLAFGIGAAAAVYSLIDALLLHPLPAVHAPEELVAAFTTHAGRSEQLRPLSWANYVDYAGQTNGDAVLGLAAAADCDLSLTYRGPAPFVTSWSGAATSRPLG